MSRSCSAFLLAVLLPSCHSIMVQPPVRPLAPKASALPASSLAQEHVETAQQHSSTRKQRQETVTQWCHAWAKRSTTLVRAPEFLAGANRRSCVPFMEMTAERPPSIHRFQSELRTQMRPHREARRLLANQLEQVQKDMRRLWSTCVGDECIVGDEKLRAQENALREELDQHRQQLEELDDERLAVLRSAVVSTGDN